MSNRLVRINELVQREISAYLRKQYQREAASVTISGVEIASDLKTGKVFVAVIGSLDESEARMRWLRTKAHEIRRHVGANIVMKWTPELQYLLDGTPERAGRVMEILAELDRQDRGKTGA
jgi:ribosome-binding factor A